MSHYLTLLNDRRFCAQEAYCWMIALKIDTLKQNVTLLPKYTILKGNNRVIDPGFSKTTLNVASLALVAIPCDSICVHLHVSVSVTVNAGSVQYQCHRMCQWQRHRQCHCHCQCQCRCQWKCPCSCPHQYLCPSQCQCSFRVKVSAHVHAACSYPCNMSIVMQHIFCPCIYVYFMFIMHDICSTVYNTSTCLYTWKLIPSQLQHFDINQINHFISSYQDLDVWLLQTYIVWNKIFLFMALNWRPYPIFRFYQLNFQGNWEIPLP
jgi:hypothetical protein